MARVHLALLRDQPQDAEVRAGEPVRAGVREENLGLTSLLPVLEAVLKTQRPLLIVAEDVERAPPRSS